MSYPLQQIEDQVSTLCSSSGSYQTFVFPCLSRWGIVVQRTFCASSTFGLLQLRGKIFILGGNMSRLARFAAKPRIQFLLCLATIPIFGRITKLDCVSHWPLPVSNWSDVTLAEALGCLFYAIVLPSPRLAPRESGSSTTARRFQTKASAATI